jgi:hypothetical protein
MAPALPVRLTLNLIFLNPNRLPLAKTNSDVNDRAATRKNQPASGPQSDTAQYSTQWNYFPMFCGETNTSLHDVRDFFKFLLVSFQ